MFDDKFFDQWLDGQSQRVMQKVAEGHGILPEEMMILTLKAQSNHFVHLDQDLRDEVIGLRRDMDQRFEETRKDMDQRFERVDERFEQVDKRFEQVDKRFEQVDKRFEQMDKRFEQTQEELKRLYQAINAQTWKMIGAIGLIVVLARLADSLHLGGP